MPKKVNFIYRLDGQDMSDGLDVFELAPILLSVGELIKESNRTLNPYGKDIAVNVKPFEKGSFIIDILLFAGSNYQQIIDLVNNNSIQEIKELLEWIGLIGGGTSYSLVWLIKKLKGKPKTVEQISANEIRYTAENNITYTVNPKVAQLFQNCKIQNLIYSAYGKPLENENIEDVECYLKDEKENTNVIFEKETAKSIKKYSEAVLPSLTAEEDVETSMEVFVSPKRGSFDADPRQWSFRMGGSKDQIIKATIKDEKFLQKYKNNEIRLHFTDVLKVKLVQKLKKRGGVIDIESGVNEIEKVLEYHPAKKAEQTRLE